MATAVILHVPRLSVRIDDSKRLTPLQRTRAFHTILEHADVGFGIVCAGEIDQLNILQATLSAMRQAVNDLPQAPDLILVDGPMSPPVSIPCRPFIRGDQHSYVIGCASIMAKVLRDRLMEFYHDLTPDYAFNQHKGYGTALHAERLRAFGPSVFHRRSFAPVANIGDVFTFAQPASRAGPVAGHPPRPSSPVGLRADAGVPRPAPPALRGRFSTKQRNA